MGLILDCARSGERGLLDLEGVLNEEGAAELKRRSMQLIATGCNELSFNLERVPSISPAGIETLTRVEAMLPGTRRALTITGTNPLVRAQLDRAGLGDYIEASSTFDPFADMFGSSLIGSSA